MGEEIDSSDLPQFVLYFRLFAIESDMFYETDKRKIQEDCKILARELWAGKQPRSLIAGHVCTDDVDLRLVGYPCILIGSRHQYGRSILTLHKSAALKRGILC